MGCSDKGKFSGIPVCHCGASVVVSGYGSNYLSDTKSLSGFIFI